MTASDFDRWFRETWAAKAEIEKRYAALPPAEREARVKTEGEKIWKRMQQERKHAQNS